ncbi:ATP-dependent helicase/nuclease subunit A [bacterium BMS3Abin04]|nr:ATP-dependent helicase/nuclease subunit A [bacterium BMS3Abin04]
MSSLTPYQLKALEYNKHISLTANAGSGKTYVLSKRFVEIAMNENVDINNIVAITFTDKAAGELYSKIAKEIDDRLEIENQKSSTKRLLYLRRSLVSANISTIHSFCIDILKEFAPEAELDVNFVPIDTITSQDLLDQSVEELLKNFVNKNKFFHEIKYLIRYFGSKTIFVNGLKNSIGKRRDILELIQNYYNKDVDELSNIFRKIFEKEFIGIIKPEIRTILKAVKKINNHVILLNETNESALEAQELLGELETETNILKTLELLKKLAESILIKSGKIKTRGYLDKDFHQKFIEETIRVGQFFSSIKNLELTKESGKIEKELAVFGKVFTSVFSGVLKIYQRRKKERAYLDFEDILLFTEKLILKKNVREYLKEKFKFIMIDEYQDTNEVQYNIFMPLLENLKRGNLFVVGDEKQSIYMFRNAELEIFNKTKVNLSKKKGGGELLVLPHSFRLAPKIAAFTNVLFSKLFSEHRVEFNEVNYNELICAHPEKPEGNIEFLLADEADGLKESDLVAKKILNIVNNLKLSLQFNDIAILCRKRSNFAELEKVFVKYGIPYLIQGGKGFYQQQIIQDIYNYLSFLINTNNDNALVSILRSPFFTFSDAELLEISLVKSKTFFNKLVKYSKINIEKNEAVVRLKKHIAMASKVELPKLLRIILRDSGYWTIVAAKPNAEQELANLEKIISIANSFSNQSLKTRYDFVSYLADAIESLEDEGQAATRSEQNAVQIMTLHKAKGLEFKVVFLYRTNQVSQKDNAKSKKIYVDKNYGIMTKVPIDNNYFGNYKSAPITWIADYIYRKKNLAEIKRLLYVGITRAKEYLFISATHKDFKFKDESFIGLAMNSIWNYTEDKIKIDSELKFMRGADSNYEVYSKQLNFEIPIIGSIDFEESKITLTPGYNFPKEIHTQKISDSERNEIISATKIAVYSQCPVKYRLTYELGYSKLFKMQKELRNLYEFNMREDEELKVLGDVRGRIIHTVLEQEVKEELLDEAVEQLLKGELLTETLSQIEFEKSKKSIVADLKRFYKSAFFSELKKHNSYKNEYEVYTAGEDYFLYGIIDRLIIEKDKLIIVDYKSDNVNSANIKRKSGQYFKQLKFYSYTLSKLFPEVNEFEMQLVFIISPEEKIVNSISRKELQLFGEEIKSIVWKIRAKNFQPNFSHCKYCHFTIDGTNCIKQNVFNN